MKIVEINGRFYSEDISAEFGETHKTGNGIVVIFPLENAQYLCERCGYQESSHPNKACAGFAVA